MTRKMQNIAIFMAKSWYFMCICGQKKINCISVLRNIYISARLDGTGEKMRSKMSQHSSIEDWLELGSEIVDRKPTKLGQKRVRWPLSFDFIASRLN